MGVSLYVMPLGTFLRGEFKTTWGIRSEAGEEAPGFRGDVDAEAALASFRERLSTFIVTPLEWDEESDFRYASTMGTGSFARPGERARQWAYRVNLPRLQGLAPPQVWLPVSFEPSVRALAPWDPETEIRVVSSQGLSSEFDRLLALLMKEPRMDELSALPAGTMLAGPLAEFDGELSTVRHLRRIAGLSVEHRIPVIVAG